MCSRCVKPNLCLTAIIRRSCPCTPYANRPAFVIVGVAALARGSHVRRRRARTGEDRSRYDCLALDDCSGWCARSVEHGQRPSAVDRTDRSRSHCFDCLVPLGRYSLANCRSFIGDIPQHAGRPALRGNRQRFPRQRFEIRAEMGGALHADDARSGRIESELVEFRGRCQTTVTFSVPTPAIVATISSPRSMAFTPAGVPAMITSPA